MSKPLVVVLLSGLVFFAACGQEATEPAEEAPVEAFFDRWDVTVKTAEGSYPSWFELTRDGDQIDGRFVGRVGSARPIETIELSGNELHFSLPVQYEQHSEDMWFRGFLGDGRIEGTTNDEDGSTLTWEAVPAPELTRSGGPDWGEPIDLLAGDTLDQWYSRSEEATNNWTLEDGVLSNSSAGTDLVTNDAFMDFKLQAEFMYPEGSNSGIYLRGRYEVQVQDDYGKEPGSRFIGGVYGFLTPTKNAGRQAGEWQSYEITLLGRRVTIVLNGEVVIDNEEIPGITGGALDSNEGEPGPLMLQGDHGPISFRDLVLTPASF